jgi:hypothetical protein
MENPLDNKLSLLVGVVKKLQGRVGAREEGSREEIEVGSQLSIGG